MTTNSPQESARIFQFPLRGRFASDNERTAGHGQAATARVVRAAVGGSWYHEEAIREADRSRKN